MTARHWFALVMGAALAVTLAFLVLPVVAIFTHTAPHKLVESLGNPVATDALRLSLETTAIAVAIIVAVGTPAAYMLASRSFRGRSIVITLVELPLVLPPAVAGIALLAALGPHGILGGVLQDAHIELVLRTAGVIVALIFVSAPFYIRQAQASFEAVDQFAPGRGSDARVRRSGQRRSRRGSGRPPGPLGGPRARVGPGAR